MTEEIEPDHDGTSLWIPRSQEHKGFAVCHIDKFLSDLHSCKGDKCQHSERPGDETPATEGTSSEALKSAPTASR